MYPIWRRPRTVATAVLGTTAALAATAAVALAQPVIGTSRGCYVVGHSVQLGGSGFAPSQAYTLTVDGVYLGSRTTDAEGGLSVTFGPGPLPAGAAQHVDHVAVSDGLGNLAGTVFTLTRPAGARIAALATGGQYAARAALAAVTRRQPGIAPRMRLHARDSLRVDGPGLRELAEEWNGRVGASAN